MKEYGMKFSRKKEEAVARLLTAWNIEEAARMVGVGKACQYGALLVAAK
jgi:hypothetical protein